MISRFGTIGTLWPDIVEVRSGRSNRGCVEKNCESSWVSWNVVRAFDGSADETLTTPEIPAAPSGVIPSSSTSTPISPGASSSSGVKRTALPNSFGVSSGSGVKRAHGGSIVNDDEEQPRTRARITNLIAGLHGADASEDGEMCSGDGITDEWLSSWYPETHKSQKMVIEAQEDEGVSRCLKGIHGKRRRGEDDQHQVGHREQRNGRTSNFQGSSGSTRVQHRRQAW